MNYFKSSKTQNRESGDENATKQRDQPDSFSHLNDEEFCKLVGGWLTEWHVEPQRNTIVIADLTVGDEAQPDESHALENQEVDFEVPDFLEVEPQKSTSKYEFANLRVNNEITVYVEY